VAEILAGRPQTFHPPRFSNLFQPYRQKPFINGSQDSSITMGRELQKKKRRSGRQPVKMSNKPKNPLNPRGNTIIAKNWFVDPFSIKMPLSHCRH
jgi:nucleolar protein 16